MSEEDKNITFGTVRKLYDDIERLERTNNEIFKANETLAEEIERLNNIINELEKDSIVFKKFCSWIINRHEPDMFHKMEIINKLQELKDSDSNE